MLYVDFCVGAHPSKRSGEGILVVESTCACPTGTSDRRRMRLSVSRRRKTDREVRAPASAHDMGFCALWIENWSGKFLVAPQVTLPFDKKARVISELHRSRRANFTGLHYGRNTPEKNYLTDS